MKFNAIPLHQDLLRSIRDTGFDRCTPVQEQTLLESLSGRDIIAQAQTGTGKTAAFLITIFHRLSTIPQSENKPHALILVPTRELAAQVESDAAKLGRHLPLSIVNVIGGVPYEKQLQAIKSGVDIVVGTPGRLIDLLKSNQLSLRGINHFVIDEADRMFDMGFVADVRYVAGKIQPVSRRQTMLFSATLDARVWRLAERYTHDPEEIEIEPEQITVESVVQVLYHVSMKEKLPLLLGLLKSGDITRSIIFTNTKIEAEKLGFKLCGNGHMAEVLTGDVSQSKRFKIIERMKKGELPILVATDVAARGLHIDDVSHVINYDLPHDAASYVHRIGRTARTGKAGHAISLACEKLVLNLADIETHLEHKIEQLHLEDWMLAEDKAGRFYPARRPEGGRLAGHVKPGGKHGQQADRPSGRRTPHSSSQAKPTGTAARSKRDWSPLEKKGTMPKASRPSREQSFEDRKKHYQKKYGISPK